jgi:hypothetical protein
MDKNNSIWRQLQRNLIAIISLAFAMTGLAYNTWRNEQTEENRNVREATFEILVKLGDLQRVVFFSHYDQDLLEGNPRSGWAYALTISDLSQVVPEPMPECTSRLKETWGQSWSDLGKDEESVEKIGSAIDECRDVALKILRELR